MATTTAALDLSSIWLFSACSAKELRMVRKALEELTVKPGKVLCEEGTPGREFFLIVDGEVAVQRGGRRVATLGPGQYFGELALLDREPRSATVTAQTPVHLLVLDRRAFTGLLDAVPALAHKLLVAMAARLREADARAFH